MAILKYDIGGQRNSNNGAALGSLAEVQPGLF